LQAVVGPVLFRAMGGTHALRIDMFVKSTRPSIRQAPGLDASVVTRFELIIRKHNLKATAVLLDDDFYYRGRV
jgi:hypothetical protein